MARNTLEWYLVTNHNIHLPFAVHSTENSETRSVGDLANEYAVGGRVPNGQAQFVYVSVFGIPYDESVSTKNWRIFFADFFLFLITWIFGQYV